MSKFQLFGKIISKENNFDNFIKALTEGNLENFNTYYKKEYLNEPIENDVHKRSPIHIAAEKGHYKVIQMLIDNGCDFKVLSEVNKTPLDYAKVNNHTECIHLLEKNIADRSKIEHKRNIQSFHQLFKELPTSSRDYIGRGSFGDVFKYYDKNSAQTYAIKEVNFTPNKEDTDEVKNITNEIKIYSKLPYHRNIVQYYDTVRNETAIYIYMEYMSGNSIAKRLLKEGSMNPIEIAHYCKQILHGMDFLHENKVIHRDIKGENILLDNDNNIKLSDFGLSKSLDTIYAHKEKKVANTDCGTPYFKAPEIKKDEYNELADVWSFGVTVIEMFTAKRPELSTFISALNGKNSEFNLSAMTKELKSFIISILKEDPKKRPTVATLLDSDFIRTATRFYINNGGVCKK